MSQWPAFLPAPQIQFALNEDSAVLRTRMEGANVRQRRRYRQTTRYASARWEMSDTQYGQFQTWMREFNDNGNGWFNLTVLQGDGMKSYLFRFVGATYQADYMAPLAWIVSAQLETQTGAVLPDGSLDDIEGYFLIRWGNSVHESLTEPQALSLEFKGVFNNPTLELLFPYYEPDTYQHILWPDDMDFPIAETGFYQGQFNVAMSEDETIFDETLNGWRYRTVFFGGKYFKHLRTANKLAGRFSLSTIA